MLHLHFSHCLHSGILSCAVLIPNLPPPCGPGIILLFALQSVPSWGELSHGSSLLWQSLRAFIELSPHPSPWILILVPKTLWMQASNPFLIHLVPAEGEGCVWHRGFLNEFYKVLWSSMAAGAALGRCKSMCSVNFHCCSTRKGRSSMNQHQNFLKFRVYLETNTSWDPANSDLYLFIFYKKYILTSK